MEQRVQIERIDGTHPSYPNALRERFGSKAPVLYVAGNVRLFNTPCMGFVGSRDIDGNDVAAIGYCVNQAVLRGYTAVSGGACGTDSRSVAAALAKGGSAIEYLAQPIAKRLRVAGVVRAVLSGKLLLVSADSPSAEFSTVRAMSRNRLIYAQSEACVVIRAGYQRGGTWHGATEAMRKGYCRVLCYENDAHAGNRELVRLGAVKINGSWDGGFEMLTKPEQISIFQE